jgi:hypothetical protein
MAEAGPKPPDKPPAQGDRIYSIVSAESSTTTAIRNGSRVMGV